jgi:hypothetical protein
MPSSKKAKKPSSKKAAPKLSKKARKPTSKKARKPAKSASGPKQAIPSQSAWAALSRRQHEQLLVGMDEGAPQLDRQTASALKELAWFVVEGFDSRSPDEPLGTITPAQHDEIAKALFQAYQVYVKKGMDEALKS